MSLKDPNVYPHIWLVVFVNVFLRIFIKLKFGTLDMRMLPGIEYPVRWESHFVHRIFLCKKLLWTYGLPYFLWQVLTVRIFCFIIFALFLDLYLLLSLVILILGNFWADFY